MIISLIRLRSIVLILVVILVVLIWLLLEPVEPLILVWLLLEPVVVEPVVIKTLVRSVELWISGIAEELISELITDG